MADYGIKISKDGYDVKTASDSQLVMSSKYNLLKTKMTGTVTGPTTIAHGLAYIPIFFTTQVISTKNTIIGDDFTTTCDSTNLNIDSYQQKYYIFYQQAI